MEIKYGLKNAGRAALWIRKKGPESFRARTALILGSGLGGLAGSVRVLRRIPYGKIPGFAAASVSGHRGELVFARWSGREVLIFSGRSHLYEGISPSRAVFPVRVMGLLGIRTLVVTAAAGAMNPRFRPGDIVVLRDHVNFMGVNPLGGEHEPGFGERFPDMSACYDPELRGRVLAIARGIRVRAHAGCYWAVAGPSYETPAEIKAFRKLGGDVVGMSVVPETLAARQMGIRVLCLAYVSNLAGGLGSGPLSHGDVLTAGRTAAKNLEKILDRALAVLDERPER